MREKCGFRWGLGGSEQVGADLNRLQGRKQWTTEDRWREGERQSGYMFRCAGFSESECHLVLFLSLSPSFSRFLSPSFYTSVPVAVHWCTDSIFPPLSTSAISLISLLCSGSLSFNRHNKAMLLFHLHSIPTVHPSLTQTLPAAGDIQTHLHWTTLWSSYKPDWRLAKGGAFITKGKYIKR